MGRGALRQRCRRSPGSCGSALCISGPGYAGKSDAPAGPDRDAARSQKIAGDLAHRYPTGTTLNNVNIPIAQALADLQHNQPAQAVAHLEIAAPYEFGSGANASGFAVNYLLAEAYLRLKDGAKAAAEYQKILAHHGTDLDLSLQFLASQPRTRLRPRRQYSASEVCLSGLLRRLERRRPECSRAKGSQSRIREAAIGSLRHVIHARYSERSACWSVSGHGFSRAANDL